MNKKLWVVVMLAVMMTGGCSPDEQKSKDKVTEQSGGPTMVETVEETGAPQEGSPEPGRNAGPTITGADAVVDERNSAEQERLPATTATVNDGSQAMHVAEKKEIEAETPVALQDNQMEAVEQRGEELPVAAESSQSLAVMVEIIVINNDHGQVVLQHQKHAEAFGCAVCHAGQQPGPLELGKDKAHVLCQGCHQEKKAGPTSCLKCHQKKEQAVEGC